MEKTSTEFARTEPGVGADDDMLSSLPDELISHILSFLPTKYAVGTAILSRRWKHLWTRVSNLDFDSSLTYQPPPWKIFRDLWNGQMKYEDCRLLELEILKMRVLKFSRFVYKVLSEHKNLHSVRLFRFHFSLEHSEREVSPCAWFDWEWVFGPPVEEIDMVLDGEMEFQLPYFLRCLPQSFYTLMNLKVVKLEGVGLSAVKGSVLLPSVKILQLCQVHIEDFETLRSLISGCPVLETAILEGGCLLYRDEQDILVISLPSLKNLKLIRFDNYNMCPIVIEAPNLEELHLQKFTELEIVGSSPLSCLHSAHVDSDPDKIPYPRLLNGGLNQLSNAKKMFLSQHTLYHLSDLRDTQLPDFPNLTHLTIENGGDGRFLNSLLHSASKLHTLVIDMGSTMMPMQWDELKHFGTPECLLSSLEEIEVKHVAVSEGEMRIVAYFLEAGVVLKKVNIHGFYCHFGVKERTKLDSMLKLPRGSKHCEVRLWVDSKDGEQICINSDSEADIGYDMDHDCYVYCYNGQEDMGSDGDESENQEETLKHGGGQEGASD